MADARTIATYNAKAQDYARIVTQDAPDDTLQTFVALIPEGGAVLDLGCGPGAAAFHMQNAGLAVDPIDASEEMVAIARNRYGLEARLGHFDDVSDMERYDGIWANFSLLHAESTDLPRHLAALFKATKPGGVIHIGMKTGTGTARDDIDRLYTYVTADDLRGLLTGAGYDVTYMKEGKEAGLAGTVDPFVIMRGKKP